MTTSHVVLLIEDHTINNQQSLARSLSLKENDSYHLIVSDTPEMALKQVNDMWPQLSVDKYASYKLIVSATPEMALEQVINLWPNLIIFNMGQNNHSLFNLQRSIQQLGLDIPHIIIGNEHKLATQINPETVLITPEMTGNLLPIIEEAIANQKERFIRLPNLVLDCQQNQVLHRNECHSLTPKEFKLLRLLMLRHDRILTRKEIMQQVWETDFMGDTRTLDVHIRWLRKKIEVNPSKPGHLKTVRGEGYIFVTQSL